LYLKIHENKPIFMQKIVGRKSFFFRRQGVTNLPLSAWITSTRKTKSSKVKNLPLRKGNCSLYEFKQVFVRLAISQNDSPCEKNANCDALNVVMLTQ
jgi:hypothetical protein